MRVMPFGIAVNVGAVVVVAVAFGCGLTPRSDVDLRLLALAVALAGFALLAADLAAVAVVTLIGFLIFDGFLVNGEGQLSWHGPSDLWRLAVLVLAAGAGWAVGTARQWLAQRRRFTELEAFANCPREPLRRRA